MLNVGRAKLSGALCVLKERGDARRDLLQDVLGRRNREVSKVFLGKVDDLTR